MRGVELVRVHRPIPDKGVIDRPGYDRIVATIHKATERGAVYAHCWGGVGRTATVVGCLLVHGGLHPDAALARIDELRAPTSKGDRSAPRTAGQRQVIHDFARLADG